MTKACILCNLRPATTAEHTFKGDIYQDITGDGKAWLIHGDEPWVELEDRRAKGLTPKKNLCEICNNKTSRKPDRAISALHEYLNCSDQKQRTKKLEEIKKRGGKFFIELKRYFAKALACAIDRYDYPVPPALGKMFTDSNGLGDLSLDFRADERRMDFQILERGPLIATIPREHEQNATEWIRAGNLPDTYAIYFVFGVYRYDVILTIPNRQRKTPTEK